MNLDKLRREAKAAIEQIDVNDNSRRLLSAFNRARKAIARLEKAVEGR